MNNRHDPPSPSLRARQEEILVDVARQSECTAPATGKLKGKN